MERLEYHKLKNIDNIEVYGSTICKRYYHIKEIRFLGVKIQSEGFMYKPFFGKKYRASESDLKKLIIKDFKVYSKPYAKIIFSTTAIFFKEFYEYEDAFEWADDIANKLYEEEEINLTIIN